MGNHWAFAASCALASVLLLGGCPTVDLGDTPPDIGLCNPSKGIAYFTSDIERESLKVQDAAVGCARTGGSCHNQSHGMALDATAPIDDNANYRVVQSYLNCGQPSASQLLTKPLAGIDGHGGGDLFANVNDPAVQTFLMWFM